MITIFSPLTGWATPLEHVPDPVFAERMLGDGIAVDPVEGRLVAPGDGVVSNVHSAGHAVTLELDSGPVLLIHVGLDTIGLGGEGFSPRIKDGQRVSTGETLIEFDLDFIARRARSLVTPVIVTNGDFFEISSVASEGAISSGEPLLNLEPVTPSAEASTSAQQSASRSLRLLLAHGLHARPAARLSKLAGDYDAQAEIVAEDGRVASARSPVAMLALGLRHGAQIVIRAAGAQGEEAVEAIAALLASGMGELLPLPEKVAAEPADASKPPRELRGVLAVPGPAIGPAWRLREQEIAIDEHSSDARQEREALAAARTRVQSALAAEAQGSSSNGDIAAAHLAMIGDPALDQAALRLIESGKSAGFAWREAINQLAAPLRSSRDPRFAERLDDLIDLERRVLIEIAGVCVDFPKPPRGAIVIGEKLYPSQLKAFAEAEIAGIATIAGGATSHAAIIAAGLGMPMLVGLGPELAMIDDETLLILRGDSLIVADDEEMLDRARKEVTDRLAFRNAARAVAQELATTADGTRIEVFANLGSVAEAEIAVSEGAEGCGLLRTEFLFLDRDAPPSEEEQRQAYQAIANVLGERPLIVRTLDIGADKPVPWLPLQVEDNPALGLRGIRLQLERPDLLETQLRALLGVRSSGPLRIMLPMVSNLAEVSETKAVLKSLADEMDVAEPDLGIMVETPAAALLAASLAEEASFLSIGSNDLSQYALARDRTNSRVASGLDGLDPAVLRLIDQSVRGGDAHGRITGVCGGLAATAEAVPILVGLGITELSVPGALVAETKAIVRSLDVPACQSLASQALAAPDAGAVRALVTAFVEQRK